MDIARPSNARKKRIRQIIYAVVGLLAVALVSFGLSRLKPAAPTVERAVVWPAKVERGPMVRQVRGLGTLTPEDIRWIPATTQGRVEKILLRSRAAAAQVEADFNKAKMQFQMNQQLSKDQLVSALVLEQSKVDAEQLAVRNQIAKDQLFGKTESSRAQLAVQQSAVDQAR